MVEGCLTVCVCMLTGPTEAGPDVQEQCQAAAEQYRVE